MTSWIFEKEYEDYKKEQEYREFVENMRGGLNKELKREEKPKTIKSSDTDTLNTFGFIIIVAIIFFIIFFFFFFFFFLFFFLI